MEKLTWYCRNILSLIKIQAQFASLYKYVFKNSGVQTVQIVNNGILAPNSFRHSKISAIHFAGKVYTSKTSLKAIQAKRWVCTKDFNHLDAVYTGTNIHVKDWKIPTMRTWWEFSKQTFFNLYEFGTPEGIRTPDLLFRRESLCPSELLVHFFLLL